MATETLPGPVDFVLIEFPADASTASTAEALARLVDAGTVLIYDLALICKNGGGRSDRVDLGSPVENAGMGFEERFAERDARIYAEREQAYEHEQPVAEASPPPATSGQSDTIQQLKDLAELKS